MKHRRKIIKIADASELGWRLVTEYASYPLASDSEDEQRIYKAEARAIGKMKAERGSMQKRLRLWSDRCFGGRRVAETVLTDSYGGATQQTKEHVVCFACGVPRKK